MKNFYNLLKSAGEIFLSGLGKAKNVSVAFRFNFRIFFRVFQTVFRIDLKVFRGQFRSADMPPYPTGLEESTTVRTAIRPPYVSLCLPGF